MRPPHRRRASVVAVALAVTLLAGCGALDGDAVDGPADGVLDGDVVASAYDGDVAVTLDEFATLVTYADGDDAYTALTSADPTWEDALARQRQVLSVLVIQEVFAHAAAEDFDIEVTDADIQERFDERVEEVGGEEAFAQQLEEAGVSEDLARVQVGWELLAEELQVAVAGDGGPDPDALQAWQLDALQEAAPVVDTRFGVWNPASFSVEPDPGPGV